MHHCKPYTGRGRLQSGMHMIMAAQCNHPWRGTSLCKLRPGPVHVLGRSCEHADRQILCTGRRGTSNTVKPMTGMIMPSLTAGAWPCVCLGQKL